MAKDCIIGVLGPTAVGKTRYAIKIAQALHGEIISCDSMQIYQYMDIGSAKATREERDLIPHHLIDFLDPRQAFTAYDYKQKALAAITDIQKRGKIPVFTGGTGLYFDAVLFDLDLGARPAGLSKERQKYYDLAEKQGPEALHRLLAEVDPQAACRIHPHNIKRMVRAMESASAGIRIRDFSRPNTDRSPFSPILLILERDREELYNRINCRVDRFFEEGLLEEVKHLMAMGLTETDLSMQGLGYKEGIAYWKGEMSLEECRDLIKKRTRHYAKRQETWLKRYQGAKRFSLSRYEDEGKALGEMIQWIRQELPSATKATNPIT